MTDNEVNTMRAQLEIQEMRHLNELARAWDAGWCDRHLGTHNRDDNPYRQEARK